MDADIHVMDPASDVSSDDAGFSLVELIVSLSIFAILVVGLAAASASGFRVLGRSSARQSAVQIAAAEMEELRSTPFADLGLTAAPSHNADPNHPNNAVSSSGSPPTYTVGAVTEPVRVGGTVAHTDSGFVAGENLQFKVYRYVTTPSGSTTLRRATVTVTWNGRNPKTDRVDISTLMSDGAIEW